MLVLVTAYSAALLALPHENSITNSKRRAKRRMYKYILEKELDDFQTFIDSNVEKIISAWQNPDYYKRKCLGRVKVQHEDLKDLIKFSMFTFYPGDESWGPCNWVTRLKRTLDGTLICRQFAFELQSKRSSIRTKAETYWNPYKAKLSQSGSIYSTIKTMVKSGNLTNALLNRITSATVQGSTTSDSVKTNRP